MLKVCTHETYLYEGIEELDRHRKEKLNDGWVCMNVSYNVHDSKNLHTAMYEKKFH